MKRFLVDALLVLMLVSLASYISEPQGKQSLEDKVTEFEEDVAKHEPIKQKVETTRLNEIHENKAAKLAESGSDFVIDVMHTGMDLVSEFVQGFMN